MGRFKTALEIKTKVVTAPQRNIEIGNEYKVFLAGTIEMGNSENWQKELIEYIKRCEEEVGEELEVTIFNPRRETWDSSWEQSISNSKFREQVEWELNALENADFIVFYFDPSSKSPISLMELGAFVHFNQQQILVCCPEGFYRKGNVDIFCDRYNIPTVGDKQTFFEHIVGELSFIIPC